MKTILQFNITHDDNVYTAEGVNAPMASGEASVAFIRAQEIRPDGQITLCPMP
jgi:hypothetical protein